MSVGSRWAVAVAAALACFGGCWAGLAADRVLDTGSQVGVASVLLVVVLTVLGAWAERAREKKAEPAGPGEVTVSAEGSPQAHVTGQVSGGIVIGPGASLVNPVFNQGAHEDEGKEPLKDRAAAGLGDVLVVGDVPQEPAAFQLRAGLMESLGRGPGARVSVVFAVTGIRGVGKTQVAAAHARRRIAEGWRLVAWVDASDEASLLAGLAQVAVAAGLGPVGEDARVLATGVRHWLEADGERRLLVFDNAANLDVLRSFVPACGAGQVVVTSNRRSAEDLGAPVPVDVFSGGEALAFLAERTRLDDAAGARKLAEELGFLPLGLAQAAALIAREHLSHSTYLERLRVLPVSDYLHRTEGDAYPYRLAEAVVLSLRAAEARDPSGRCGRLMGLVSVLAETGVPRALLHLAASIGILSEDQLRAVDVDAALGELADASLLGFTLDDSVVAHRLVMRVSRERLASEGLLPVIATGAGRLLAQVAVELEEPWRNPAGVRDLAGQVGALAMHLAGHGDTAVGGLALGLLRLRLRTVYLLNELGNSSELAILASEPLVAECEQVLGADHLGAVASRSNLAAAYQDAGRTAEAIPLYERTLADHEHMLGPDHPETLKSRNNLAMAYQAAGRTAEAIPLHERTLADRERVLGADHPGTLGSRNNLAMAYQAAGRTEEAIPLNERTLADNDRVLGPDHPDTLTSRNNLAMAYEAAGRTAEAIPLHERTLADRERVLGPDHPDTLTSRNNLAAAYSELGRTEEAISLYEGTLADFERVLGKDHPGTLGSRNNLAMAYEDAGRTEEAIPLYERTLADRERVIGSDHPSTLTSGNNLAMAYHHAGRTEEAIPLLERTLADFERVLGADHPSTLTSRNNLAVAYEDAGRAAEAISLYERTLADRGRVLGADHPDALTSGNNLAMAYHHAGRTEEAIPLLERTLADFERVLGGDHPSTDVVRSNITSLRSKPTDCSGG